MNNRDLNLAVEYVLILIGTLILMRLMHGTLDYIQLIVAEFLILAGALIGDSD